MKLTLADIGSLNQSAVATINSNWDLIVAAFEEALFRNGLSPNQMEADLDMNENDILNIDLATANRIIATIIEAEDIRINGASIGELTDIFIDYLNQVIERATEAQQAAALSLEYATDSLDYSIDSQLYAEDSADSAAQAEDLVEQATAGFIGFQDNIGYDFGYVATPTTYFDRDFGSIIDPVT